MNMPNCKKCGAKLTGRGSLFPSRRWFTQHGIPLSERAKARPLCLKCWLPIAGATGRPGGVLKNRSPGEILEACKNAKMEEEDHARLRQAL